MDTDHRKRSAPEQHSILSVAYALPTPGRYYVCKTDTVHPPLTLFKEHPLYEQSTLGIGRKSWPKRTSSWSRQPP
jgi:hypothetical protein